MVLIRMKDRVSIGIKNKNPVTVSFYRRLEKRSNGGMRNFNQKTARLLDAASGRQTPDPSDDMGASPFNIVIYIYRRKKIFFAILQKMLIPVL